MARLRTRNMYTNPYTNKQVVSITPKIAQIVTQNGLFVGVFRRCSTSSDNTYLCSETLKIQQKTAFTVIQWKPLKYSWASRIRTFLFFIRNVESKGFFVLRVNSPCQLFQKCLAFRIFPMISLYFSGCRNLISSMRDPTISRNSGRSMLEHSASRYGAAWYGQSEILDWCM